jgi:hypothetical protein
MPSSILYPAALDNTSTLPTVFDNTTPVKAENVNILRDAILAIEATLGVKPQGIYTTVRARLDALDAIIASIISGGGGGGGGGGTVVFAGDLMGTTNHQIVIGLQNNPINPIVPIAGQTLIFDGYQWNPSTNFLGLEIITGPILSTSENTGLIELDGKFIVNGINISPSSISDMGQGIIYYDSTLNKFQVSEDGGSYVNLIGGSTGGIASGDLDGYYPDPVVIGIQTIPVNSISPTAGQALMYDGYQWTPGSNFINQDIFTTGSITSGPDLSTSATTGLLTLDGKMIINSIDTSFVSDSGQAIMYFDGYSNSLLISENGNPYVNLFADIRNIVNINTTGYTTTQNDSVILVTSSGSPITVNLINNPIVGTVHTIKDKSGNSANVNYNITVQSSGGALIDGAASYVIEVNYASVSFMFDGTNWYSV